MIRKIARVKAKKDFTLECIMENGEIISYDMSSLLNKEASILEPLKEEAFFKRVFLEDGHLAWPNGFDIHAESVVRDGKLISREAA